MLIAAESKREEEKAKGATDDTAENPDIVLFDDNEEEEEDESDEEDDGAVSAQGRGRGRGMFWQPPMQLARGVRPVLGVRGFPPVMMGIDGGYGAVGPEGFAAPDLFGGAPRVFAPYGGQRFSSDFSGAGPMSGLVFPGRAPQPGIFPIGGLGMMMGSGRAFMGGIPMAGVSRPNRPISITPFFHPPPPPSNWATKREQRRAANDRYESGSDQGNRGQEAASKDDLGYQQGSRVPNEDRFGAGNRHMNDESESDDEAAPRRSRHGETSKKRRGSEGEVAADHWEAPFTEASNL